MSSNNCEEFNPFEQMTFTYDRCFLCGQLLNQENTSEEHVYPKWLQRDFDLWTQELILLNGTPIKYKNLKIPCCKDCNNKMSGSIENPIKQGVSLGYDAFISIDEKIVFQWLNKISYGILFKELSLRSQQSDRNSTPIYKEEYLKEHKMQYLFLRTLISDASFVDNPWSILIFRINPKDCKPYWAYDNPFEKVFCIRMNDIGIIAHLMDNGYNKGFFIEHQSMRELLDKTLHPIQFDELSAKFLYKSSLFYRNPFYITVFDEERNPDTVISQGLSGDAYADWSQEEYAHVLSLFWEKWGYSFEDIYKGNDLVISYLRNEDGTFKNLFE